MFTGLIQDIGRVHAIADCGDGKRLALEATQLAVAQFVLGESVAVDGVCLTVVSTSGTVFDVVAGAETLACTALGERRVGDQVNLERALRMGDHLGGHLVQGHVDGVGTVTRSEAGDSNVEIDISLPEAVRDYTIPKGSITIDGISLTVNEIAGDVISVALIPHTVAHTTLAGKAVGTRVNLEADMVGKYIVGHARAWRGRQTGA